MKYGFLKKLSLKLCDFVIVSENWDHWDEVEGDQAANEQEPHCEDDEFNVGFYLCLIAAFGKKKVKMSLHSQRH